MTEKQFYILASKINNPNLFTDKQLAQLRRSSRTSANLLSKVVTEQQRRGLLKTNFKGARYPPEKLKRIKDYF